MQLTPVERIMLMGLLPKEGSFVTLKIVRDLQGELGFSEEEHKKYEFRQEGDVVLFAQCATTDLKDVKMGEKATDIIREAFKKLDSEGRLTVQVIDLYSKFMEGK